MHNYHLSFMAGFLACVPRDSLPNHMRKFIESRFFSEVPNKNGIADLSILALRKIEVYLSDLGYSVVIATPQSASSFNAKAYLVSAMDPLGLGPATTTMIGLVGGNDPFNKYFFRNLVQRIKRTHPQSKVVAGGPGIWEFDISDELQALGIDCIVNGPVEAFSKTFWDGLLKGAFPRKAMTPPSNLRPDPRMMRGPSFWGMVEISRGCGRGCQFCDFELMSGFKWIPQEFILKEVEINAKSQYVDVITLLSEDTLRYGTKVGEWWPNYKVVELVKRIAEYGKRIAFTHCTFASALASPRITEEVSHYAGLDEKHLSGFQVGIESGSPKIMAKYMVGKTKPWKPEDWPEVVQQGMGIMIDNYFIPHCTLVMGLADETPSDTVQTIELVDKLRDYPSLILPLFFVPLSVLKDRPFINNMMSPEQRELLAICSNHTGRWAKRLPNWSGSLNILDKIVFQTGADYSFTFLHDLAQGNRYGMIGVWARLLRSALHSVVEVIANRETQIDWWRKTERRYPLVEKLDRQEEKVPIPIPLLRISSTNNGQLGCGCSLGGIANIITQSKA